MKKKYNINSIKQLSSVALELLSLLDNRIFALYGEVGVGKTTLVKCLCHHLKVCDAVSSPTFSIVNEYINSNNGKVFHLDLYRLKTMEEVEKLGIETYFNSGNYCFIEWPNLAENLLPENYHIIEIKKDINKRELFLIE